MKRTFDIRRFRFYCWVTLAWTIMWLLNYRVKYPDTFWLRVPNELWRNVFILFAHYFFIEYVWRKFIVGRRLAWIKFIIGFFAYAMTISFGLYAWRLLGINTGIYTSFRPSEPSLEGVSFQAGGGFAAMFVYGIAVHLYDFFRLRKDAQKLRFEKQKAELAYLKSQTNPHFLFNTLNNIYSLARDKSDLAPASILRLSALLRFMLYECNAPAAAVHKELKIIEDYIELERLRYDETLRITQNYQVDDMNEQLPPLLLVPLVENAFKHGVSESRAHPFVEIHLAIKNKRLTFTVRNSVDEQAHGIGVREGIGLANLRRQLELLFNEYKLDLHSANGVFTVIMTINLASHVEHNLHHNRR